MGQQQLLLIVLGVILVGVAVVLGIQYFGVGAEEGAKDELTAHNITIGANAQQWYKKPVAMGGGGNTFVGFETHFGNNLQKLAYSTNGTYASGAGTATQVVITGTPIQTDYDWTVITTVRIDTMFTAI
ncbi:MAG TPA: hypothetical protein VIZ21_07720, partial [Ignavibacteriaceae bacterium]